jgi:hypothetical protein
MDGSRHDSPGPAAYERPNMNAVKDKNPEWS